MSGPEGKSKYQIRKEAAVAAFNEYRASEYSGYDVKLASSFVGGLLGQIPGKKKVVLGSKDQSVEMQNFNETPTQEDTLIKSLYKGYREFIATNKAVEHQACNIFLKPLQVLLGINNDSLQKEVDLIIRTGVYNHQGEYDNDDYVLEGLERIINSAMIKRFGTDLYDIPNQDMARPERQQSCCIL